MGKRARSEANAGDHANILSEEQLEGQPGTEEAKEEPPEEQAVVEAEENQIVDPATSEQPPPQQVVEDEQEATVANAAMVEDQARRPRLMIKQIVLENFKSYGGRKLIGPFNKSFSSIVGPNGSGKSNTIDALLFVFGKRAKKMRLNKVSELIHNSGAMRDCQSAKVEVTFQDIIDTGDGPEDYAVVEGSLLTVAREAFRNNQSKYYVEGKTSNFTEVTQLLSKRGVDLEHNRFLILQGEVEQISLMKPKALTPHEDGLLEYLEDIIGSNRFVEPIDQAEQEVEQLTEVRQEKLNRLRVAERERDSLDGPRKEAEAWVSAEGERLEVQALLSQSEAWRSHSSIGKLEEDKKGLEAHMEEHKKKMEVFEKQVRVIEAEHNTQLKEHTAIKAQMEKASAEFQDFERMDVKFQTDIEFTEQKLKKLQETADKEDQAAQKLVDDAEELRHEAPRKQNELESAERFKAAQAQKLEKIYAGLKDKAEELRPLKEQKEEELVPLQKKLTEVRKVVEVAQTEAQLLREKTTKAEEEKQEVQRQLSECSERFAAREKEGKDAAKMKEDRKKLVSDAEARMKEIGSQIDDLATDVNAKRAKAEEARNSFEQEHHRSRLIRAVYEQSKAGKLSGIHGRLGDLGTISKKYDVAVSTACGLLDAIVVDTTEDAQALIEFIRQQDLGRTTCICLQKIKDREREAHQEIQTPENAPRLLDLIKPSKPEYKVAFFFALNHTLVANDLEQATRVGLKGRSRWRVVTLQGQLIDTSGTMSGGGGQVCKGGMKSSVCMYSPEEVRDMVQAYEQANNKLNGFRQERRALDEAVELTKKEISEFELVEQKCVMDVGSLKKQVDTYETRLSTLKVPTLSTGDKSKLKELEKLVTSRSKELNAIQLKHQNVEEEVRDLHNQIMNIGGEELKKAKAAMDDATKKCEDLRRFIKKAGLDIENMLKNAKKAKESAKKARGDIGTTEKALAKLKEEHALLDDKAEVVLKKYEELKTQLEEKDAVLVKLRTKREEIIGQASAQKNQEVDLVNELDQMTRTLNEHHARIQAYGQKLKDARKEYEQLPLVILEELRQNQAEHASQEFAAARSFSHLARRAIKTELAEDDLQAVRREDLEALLASLENNLQNLKPNLASIEEFRRADAEHKGRLGEYEAVNSQREDLRRKLEQLKQSRLEEFMQGFSVISMKLKEMYQMITLGGDAELELVDTLDPFSEGVSFSVRPPKKSWKQITNLSGGEKTLASLSLVFALHHYKPTPLYFMDEIDAALDFRNVSIIANYIKERTKNAQFIVISLRNHMFELADLLVGIYKTQDVSKSVAVDPTAFSVSPKAPLQDVSIVVADNSSEPMPLPAPPATGGNAGKRPANSATSAPKRRAVRGKEN